MLNDFEIYYLSKLRYPKSMRCSFRPRVIITVMLQVTDIQL